MKAVKQVADGTRFTIHDRKYLKLNVGDSRYISMFKKSEQHGYAIDLETSAIVELPENVPCLVEVAAECDEPEAETT